MKVHERLHGFTVTACRPVPGEEGLLYEMTYENGASLVYFARPDQNKTFAITFKTIPQDNTGVFHILEHSVLCGSDKYPVKEPFVELLKGSMQTFLNAFTFPDKTMYPVCSRNQKDFLNLIDIYMDAVLHPAILHNPNIFRQEGWHWEPGKRGEAPHISGVVLNEMKGAYSSADEVAQQQMAKLLYPDSCYGYDSGGDPRFIPTLTYEAFVAAHKRFYHPSGARIFLDGEMDIDAVLAVLDRFLRPYKRQVCDVPIPIQPPVKAPVHTVPYEIEEGDDPTSKVRVSYGYIGFSFDQQEQLVALSLINDVLCGSNEAPLKAALLSQGLCEDVSLFQYDGIQQSAEILEVRNTTDENLPRVEETVRRVLNEAAQGNLPRERLLASLNSLEFRLRERETGTQPRGLSYAIASMESWLYGGDPMQNLTYDKTLASLREKIGTDYFSDLIRRVFTESEHCATLILRPCATLGKEREAQERRSAQEWWSRATDAQKEQMEREAAQLKDWQQTEDSPAALATLARLSLTDIAPEPEPLHLSETKTLGVKTLLHEVHTNGIIYADVYFNMADLNAQEMAQAGLLCALLSRLDTQEHSALALQTELNTHIGALCFSPDILQVKGNRTAARANLRMSLSVLESESEPALRLCREILLTTRYTDGGRIRNILRQLKMAQEQSFPAAGHSAAMNRAEAALSTEGALQEYTGGLEFYRAVKEWERNFPAIRETLCAQLEQLAKRLFVRERMLLCLTGKPQRTFARALCRLVPDGAMRVPTLSRLPALPLRREGIRVPAQIAFAVQAGSLAQDYGGVALVAKTIISLEYLWNRVRVQGGAYGAGLVVHANRMAYFYSYRDPGAVRSLACYGEAAAFLRDLCARKDADIEKFIIGAISASDPVLSPRMRGVVAVTRYLRGQTYADRCRIRREMLGANRTELTRLADAIEKVVSSGKICVVGGATQLRECKDKGYIDEIISL